MRKRHWLSAVAALVLLPACTPEGPDAHGRQPAAQATLRRGNGGDPGSLDPALAEDLHAFHVLLDLYEGLLTVDADGAIVAGVAQSWSVSPDGLQYRFELRPNARWSNGERVTAAHFEHGFRHVLRQGSGSPNAHLLAPVLRYRAEGPDRFVLELERPSAWLASVLTMPVAMPRLPGVHDNPAAFADPGRFVGNGPFVLEQWTPGGVLRLRRSETFHAADSVTIEAVDYLPVTDPVSEYHQFRAGGLEVTATIPPSEFSGIRAEHPAELQVSPGMGLYYLAFDTTEPPLDHLQWRRALSLAIDRERIVRLLGRGELVACGLVPPGVGSRVRATAEWCGRDAPQRERAAQAALAAAARDQGRLPMLRFVYDSGDVHQKIALALRAMWQDVLGISVELRQLEWKAFLDQRGDRSTWDMMRFVWVGDYDDASTFTDLFASDGLHNLAGYSSARYDELLGLASRTADAAERMRLLAQAEQLLIDDHAIAPLYFMTNKHLVSTRVTGYRPNALDRHPSRYIDLGPVGASGRP